MEGAITMTIDPRDPVTPRSTDTYPDAVLVEPTGTTQPPAADPDFPDADDYDVRKGAQDVTRADLEQLRWGPIWAGLLTAIGLFILMTLPAIALGLQAAPGTDQDLGAIAVIVTSAIALIAFFLGGFVSTWSAGISDAGRSLVNGFLVWALWVVAATVLAAVGVGSIAGAMGELFGQVQPAAPDVELDQVISAVQNASWQTFLALGLTAAAATLGGAVGAREELRGAWTRVWSSRMRRATI
jgi:hypothetical protein